MTMMTGWTRAKTRHPDWCDTDRCMVGVHGGRFDVHRSKPETYNGVTLVMRQVPGQRPALEVRLAATLVDVHGDGGRLHALYLAMLIDADVDEGARVAREWQNDHSTHPDHDAYRMSTPTSGGERSC